MVPIRTPMPVLDRIGNHCMTPRTPKPAFLWSSNNDIVQQFRPFGFGMQACVHASRLRRERKQQHASCSHTALQTRASSYPSVVGCHRVENWDWITAIYA